MNQQDVKQAIRAWRNKHTTEVDRKLRTAWPELELRLQNAIGAQSAFTLVKAGPDWIVSNLIQPEVEGWVARHAVPAMEDASSELNQIVSNCIDGRTGQARVPLRADGLGAGGEAVFAAGAIMAGIGAGVAGLTLGISSFLWFFTTVSWPIVIPSLAAAAVLIWLGGSKAAKLKEEVVKRFAQVFTPKIKDALIGQGYDCDGKRHASFRAQLIEKLEDAATQAERRIKQA